MDRTILHCDLNSFFAAVECVHNPELKNVPMAVAGDPKNRHGIILAKNELAKKFKVQTAETIWQAKKKCPELVLVPPRHGEYERYSRLVNDIYNDFSDLVEPFGIDESWLDVTGVLHIFGDGKTIADKIRATVKEKLDLSVSVGVSFNKIFAKLGSDYKKPDATTVITRENYRQIVWQLPVGDLLYVGKATRAALEKLRIKTIGELANSDKPSLIRRLGKMGGLVHDYANGIDDSPVASAQSERSVNSVGNGTTFNHDLVGYSEIKKGVIALADEVAFRLRKYGVKCAVISVHIKDPNFKCISRQKTLKTPTNLTNEIIDVTMDIVRSSWSESLPIRAITITGQSLVSADANAIQLSLFDTENKSEKQEKLDMTVDIIRGKYGRRSINRGVLIKVTDTDEDKKS